MYFFAPTLQTKCVRVLVVVCVCRKNAPMTELSSIFDVMQIKFKLYFLLFLKQLPACASALYVSPAPAPPLTCQLLRVLAVVCDCRKNAPMT